MSTRGPQRAEAARALEALVAFHGEIDGAVALLAERQGGRLRCGRGCFACCLDGLSVRPIEAERIRRRQATLLREEAPHPSGGCAFLDAEGACRIYDDRPSVCRSQGLPLRVLFEDEAGEIAEQRDICPLNLDGGPPLDQLDEDDCWLVGPHELRLASLDALFLSAMEPGHLDGHLDGRRDEVEADRAEDDDQARRVPLRSLFRASGARPSGTLEAASEAPPSPSDHPEAPCSLRASSPERSRPTRSR